MVFMSDILVERDSAARAADDNDPHGPGGGDGNEKITVHRMPIATATAWLEARMAEGIMVDPKIYAGLFWAGARS